MGANDTTGYAYKAKYTSDFEIGNPKFAKIVLEIDKNFDDNTLANSVNAFADTVMVDLADGSSFRGPKDSLIKAITAQRSSYATVSTIYAMWVTLKPKGRDETWVSTWGRETDVKADSTKESAFLDESWRFNKEGKVDYIMQNTRKPHARKK